jgi:L-proline 3-hydroxylase-like protein/aspartyl/asparaginyl beta-hydroxylase
VPGQRSNGPVNTAARLSARAIGILDLEPDPLALDLATIAQTKLHPSVGYSVGSWGKCILLERCADDASIAATAEGTRVPYILERITETFRIELLRFAQVFAAKRGAFVRPHRDWTRTDPMFARVHVPLQTDERSLHSEDGFVYHMRTGEVWFVDAARAHSAGCFSETTPRLHLVLDFVPGVPLSEIFRSRNAYQPSTADRRIERPAFTAEHLCAIHELAAVVSEANLPRIVDLLSTIHFEKQVSCAATYDWLIEIARRAGNARLVERAEQLERMYLRPFD